MYCTISTGSPSSGLGEDASAAYHRFWHQARALAGIARSFDALALDVAAAYHAALTRADARAWTELVERTSALVEKMHALDRIVRLDAKEREALGFFEAIVRENADLLGAAAAITAPAAGNAVDYLPA